MYAVGLALCTFADISSEEMSRDLSNEIEKLLGSTNTYIRKKVLGLSGRMPSIAYMVSGCPLCPKDHPPGPRPASQFCPTVEDITLR